MLCAVKAEITRNATYPIDIPFATARLLLNASVSVAQGWALKLTENMFNTFYELSLDLVQVRRYLQFKLALKNFRLFIRQENVSVTCKMLKF